MAMEMQPKSSGFPSAPSFRETGIPLVGTVEWGTNLCVFYDTRDDLLKTTASFMKAGLENNERCVWAVSNPITVDLAISALEAQIPDLAELQRAGSISVTAEENWDIHPDEFNLQRITSGWMEGLHAAERQGFDGLRVSGNASWLETTPWQSFCEYVHEIDRTVADKHLIALCTHSLAARRAIDMEDAIRVQHFTLYCRNGQWGFADTPCLAEAEAEIKSLKQKIAGLTNPLPVFSDLTHRETAVLGHILRGDSSREIALRFNVSPRTIEFHRANIMSKVGARNVADLVRMMSRNGM